MIRCPPGEPETAEHAAPLRHGLPAHASTVASHLFLIELYCECPTMPKSSLHRSKNGIITAAQSMLQLSGWPELQSSPGSLQHSALTAAMRSSMSPQIQRSQLSHVTGHPSLSVRKSMSANSSQYWLGTCPSLLIPPAPKVAHVQVGWPNTAQFGSSLHRLQPSPHPDSQPEQSSPQLEQTATSLPPSIHPWQAHVAMQEQSIPHEPQVSCRLPASIHPWQGHEASWRWRSETAAPTEASASAKVAEVIGATGGAIAGLAKMHGYGEHVFYQPSPRLNGARAPTP